MNALTIICVDKQTFTQTQKRDRDICGYLLVSQLLYLPLKGNAHRNGFSPVCVRMCFLRSLSVVKYFVHPSDSQLNVLPV